MALFEGYQSRSDDEYFSDSDLEPTQVKVARLMKGNPFQRMAGGEIKLHVGQTFNDRFVLRNVMREYAIQEGVELDRVKNDLVRQTYKCTAPGCPWRAHASCMIDRTTMQLRSLVDQHDCHRLYNNKEAKVKWIAYKFENIVKRNPNISVRVIGDLLLDKYKVAVDIHRLYRAKIRALKGLRKDHANCFQYLRQYAYTLNQTNHGSTVHISIQQPLSTFQRLFLSFEAHKLGFMGGCRQFIGLDGCHLKGPCGGVLLSAVALDANSGLFPLAVCICEKEIQFSWCWFLNNLKVFLQYPADRPLTFMPDRQK
ncbi:hypothetical protein Dsin_027866 [Dipteronia sinensis]|uniref:Transposase MuDR plant domain-containing protein n=1 Tax=Dipteronia sinensis TaxID=43782 RepID=A0AAE0DTW0_9ROSI|nr:hypothetical protein Dsin_027866 [Dipteronia sinensis]